MTVKLAPEFSPRLLAQRGIGRSGAPTAETTLADDSDPDLDLELAGRIALVTGASRGIGKAIALDLAGRGADVVVNFSQSHAAAAAVAAQIEALGRRSLAVQADVSDPDAVRAMTDRVGAELGRPDILVNNAGITRDTLAMRMKDEDWAAVLATDLTGAFLVTRACMRGMVRKRWGRIITIGSVVGTMGNAGQVNYAAAKAGLAGMTRSLAKELGSRNITVNLVAPGFIRTDITADLTQEQIDAVLSQVPLERLGDPEDVAPLVGFLAGDGARYITGQVLHVDGGLVMS